MATTSSYLPRNSVSSLSLPYDELSVESSRVQSALRKAAEGTTALARGIQAAFYGWAVQVRRARQLPCGRWYMESCPNYLATVEGCTRWAASLAWKLAHRVVGWVEATTEQARLLGATLRRVKWGSRYGRHLLLHGWQLAALRAVSGAANGASGELLVDASDALARIRSGARTATVCCPLHGDSTPSLVLWASGGAQCMACQQADGTAPRWAWLAEGEQVRLLPASRTNTASACLQHNKSPLVAGRVPTGLPGAPVGGLIARGVVRSGHTSALLRACVNDAGRTLTWRTPGSRAAGGVLSALDRAEAQSLTQASEQRAREAAVFGAGLPDRAALPDRLLSVSTMGRAPGGGWATPQVPRCQQWVLVDIDDVELPEHAHDIGRKISSAAVSDFEASGRCAVVRTGPTGLQVWVELRHARHSAATWHQLPEVRAWHASLGERLLTVARENGARGGHCDPSACAAGRFGRRPGWRMVAGAPYRSHLLHVVQ